MKRIETIACLAVIPLLLAVAPVGADAGGLGPRVGLTSSPDQVHFGGHAHMADFSPYVRFQPSVEIGVGDDLTLVSFNFDALYRFRENWDVWTPYLGGGVGLHVFSWDAPGFRGGSETEVGLGVAGGIEKGLAGGSRFFVEARLGLADSPDLKLTAGWTFF